VGGCGELRVPRRPTRRAPRADHHVLVLATLRAQGENAFLAGHILTLVGFGFSVYLTYREVFTIHAICSWCVSSAIVFTLLAAVGTLRARRLSPTLPAAAGQTSA
jgi:uncharacterized membrane protein